MTDAESSKGRCIGNASQQRRITLHGGPKKVRPQTRGHSSVKSEPIFFKSRRFVGKFVVKRIFKIPPHHAYVATLPCETLMSAKRAINDKLQGSV